MDLSSTRQRSASHGALHTAYAGRGPSGNFTHPRQLPRRHPLRSVKENAALLRSPGPLESMLKTTTETGDIGIFSISPVASSMAHYQPRRLRPYTGDARLLSPPRSRAYHDEGSVQDDRRRLPSYRDTTSEILSLYGTDSQQSHSRSFSPSLDDGPRSYSMTTCSLRQIPSEKSSATLQSYGSGGTSQRPRSPFPYPTRLKRPGVRPSSPALMENGVVDYSKMVEFDHASYRTTYGSYRPTYPPAGPRRPPPLSFRSDFNRSTSSLPSQTPPRPFHQDSLPRRARTPNFPYSSMSQSSCRQRVGSADQSVRSASLTSIIEMYRQPQHRISSNEPTLQSTGLFYYDYSEAFEKEIPKDVEQDKPLCPIPQRAGSLRQSRILKEDAQQRLDPEASDVEYPDCIQPISTPQDAQMHVEAARVGEVHQVACQTTSSPAPSVALVPACWPSQTGVQIASPPTGETGQVNRAVLIYDDRVAPFEVTNQLHAEQVSTVPQTQPSVELPSSDLAWSKSLSPATCLEARRHAGTPSAHPGLCGLPREKRTSQPESHACDLATTSLAAMVSTIDSSSILQEDHDATSLVPGMEATAGSKEEASKSPIELKPPRIPLPMQCLDNAEAMSYRKKHRRNFAAMRIATKELKSSLEAQEDPLKSEEETPLLSPQNVSSVSQFRVKDDIPQLMKVLPPLPAEAQRPVCEHCGDPDSDEQSSRSHAINGVVQPHITSCKEARCSVEKKESNSAVESKPALLSRTPRFKLRIKASTSSMQVPRTDKVSASRHSESNAADQDMPDIFVKPRMKLKMSRHQAKTEEMPSGTTIIRTPGLKQCNSLADLKLCPPKDLFSSPLNVALKAGGGKPNVSMADSHQSPSCKQTSTDETSSQHSDQFSINYPASPTKGVGNRRSSVSTKKTLLGDGHSFVSDGEARGHRRLRQKLSIFRLRMGELPKVKPPRVARSMPQPKADRCPYSPDSERSIHFDKRQANASLEKRAVSARPDRMSKRMKKWADEARQAVRACVRRTLDRSSTHEGVR